MKSALALVLLVAFIAVVVAQHDYIDAYPLPGVDLISSNDTSFLDQIDWHRGLYVAGEGFIFQVNENPIFNITYHPVFRNRHSFLDFKVFSDRSAEQNQWAVGSTNNGGFPPRNSTNEWEFPGLNYPFVLTGGPLDNSIEIVESPPGYYMMSAVTVDNSTTEQVVAYWVGWHQHPNASEGVNFTMIRTIVNTKNALAKPPVFPVFQYNHTGGDRVYLHGEDYTAYSRDFKPWLFHSEKHYHIIVVDPVTNSIYKVFTPLNTNESLAYNETTGRFRLWGFAGAITGATYDANNAHIYIGLSAWGTYPGRIIVIDMINMVAIKNYTLGLFESNPKSLSLDAYGPGAVPTHLYVGLYGSWTILKISLATWNITITTLPAWISNVYGVSFGNNYVYFITNEQHAKVGRVAVQNFCSTPCDGLFGYCNNSKCLCWAEYMQVAPDGRRCELKIAPTPGPTPLPTIFPTIPPTHFPTQSPTEKPTPAPLTPEDKALEKDRSGEIALGILFAICFILAAAGWYLLWKARGGRGVYESLINRS